MNQTPRKQGPRVLVVEDEAIIRWMAVSSLEGAGFTVLEAGSADEALALLEQEQVDLLFTDIAMPGTMNGLDLVEQVLARWPQIAVLVTSGHIVPLPRQLPSSRCFIPKPYDIDRVLRRMEQLAAVGC